MCLPSVSAAERETLAHLLIVTKVILPGVSEGTTVELLAGGRQRSSKPRDWSEVSWTVETDTGLGGGGGELRIKVTPEDLPSPPSLGSSNIEGVTVVKQGPTKQTGILTSSP